MALTLILLAGFVNLTDSNTRRGRLDKSGGHDYIQSMTATAQLLREIQTMPEETAVEVLDFAKFLKGKQTLSKQPHRIATKDAYGIFKGINTHFEREEDDRV